MLHVMGIDSVCVSSIPYVYDDYRLYVEHVSYMLSEGYPEYSGYTLCVTAIFCNSISGICGIYNGCIIMSIRCVC